MAEALEVVLSLCDAASGAEGSCTDWKTLMLLLMGVAKIADIAADWVVVVKLLLGDYTLISDSNTTRPNVTHTHTLASAEGHDHADITITHTHAGHESAGLEGLEPIIAVSIFAAVLGTIIEVAAMIVTCRSRDTLKPEPQLPSDGDVYKHNRNVDKHNALVKRGKWLAFGRLFMDDVPTAAVAIYLLVAAEFELADAILLGLSGGYSLLAFVYYITRKLAKGISS